MWWGRGEVCGDMAAYILFYLKKTALYVGMSVGLSIGRSVINKFQCAQKVIKLMLQCHNFTISQCHNVTMSQCHNVTMSKCHNVTILKCCNVKMLQCVIIAFGRSIWKKHLGDVYIVKMIV